MPSASLPPWIILLLLGGAACAGSQRADGRDGGGGDDDDDGDDAAVARARCASRCLSLHSVAALSTRLQSPPQNNGSLGWCRGHKQCAKCLEPCKDSWETERRSSCRELCERAFPKKHWECVASCEFLQSALAAKQGACPAPEKARGFAAACVESCDRDRDCSARKKCCSNGCGHTCQAPRDPYRGAPLKPRQELGFQELASGQMEVRWSSRFNVSAEPVVYVLQRRWNFGIQPSEDSATSWQLVAQTTEQRARLPDVRPGRWYQFRVAAVNTHGTRGFTTPSKHIHSNRDPASPPAPAELRVSSMSFGPGRAAAARLQWSMPADPDVPVHHYKVTWSWSSGRRASLGRRRKVVRESHVELDSMRSNRSYSVEVQAVSYWGQSQLKGPRAVLHFSTQHTAGAAPSDPTGDMLDVGTPFYQDGELRVHVYWQSSADPSVERYRVQWGPEYCRNNQTRPAQKTSTQENFVSLRGLLFSCKYKVLLQPISRKTRPPAESAAFLTPSCASIQAKDPKPIACPGAAASPQAVPARAANLTASFQVRSGNVTAAFSWDASPAGPRQRLSGYRVTWTEILPAGQPSGNKLPHSLVSQSQILPPDARVLVVPGLRPASVYTLEVRAVTAGGEGATARRTFQTPGSQSAARHGGEPPKLRMQLHQQPVVERH